MRKLRELRPKRVESRRRGLRLSREATFSILGDVHPRLNLRLVHLGVGPSLARLFVGPFVRPKSRAHVQQCGFVGRERLTRGGKLGVERFDPRPQLPPSRSQPVTQLIGLPNFSQRPVPAALDLSLMFGRSA